MVTNTFAPLRKQKAPPLGYVVGLFGLLLLCVLLGLATAVLPPGLLIRALLLPIGLGFLAISWALRRKDAGMPGGFVFVLLMITVSLSVVWPRYIYFSIGGPYVNPQTLAIFASLATILFWMAYSPDMSGRVYKILFSSGKIGVLALIWLGWRLLAASLGDFPLISIFDYFRDLVYLSSFLLIGAAITSYEDGSKWMLRILLISGLFVSLAGLVEGILQKNYFVQYASGGDSQAVADALKTIMIEKMRSGSFRAQATFDHPIVFAQFIAAMVPLGVYFIIYERGWFWRSLGVLVVPVGILAILNSGSRAGVVSLAIALVFVSAVIWLRSMNSRGFSKAFAIAALPAFLLGLLIAYLVVQELLLGRSQVEANSSSIRLKMVMDGVGALITSPIWGFGHGMAVFKAGVLSGGTGTATIDSYLLSIALDAGYVGLFLFVSLIGVFALKGALAAIRLPGSEGAKVGLLVASVLALVATFAGLSIPNNMTLMWLLIAVALPSINKARELKQRLA